MGAVSDAGREAVRDARRAVSAAARAAAKALRETARPAVPRKTGALRRALRTRGKRSSGQRGAFGSFVELDSAYAFRADRALRDAVPAAVRRGHAALEAVWAKARGGGDA